MPPKKIRLLIESFPSAMIMVNRPGKNVLLNSKAEQVVGYTCEEMGGRTSEQLIHERCRAEHPQHVGSFFANPVPREMGLGREVLGLHKDGSEFPAELALGSMTAETETYVLATVVDISQRVRLARDLTVAREIQRSLFPNTPPQLFGFDIAGVCEPANETGGDFFDFIKLPNGNLVIAVGDVSGHGFGPAIRAATAQCSLRTLLRTGKSLMEAVNGVNRTICEDYPGEQFVTLATLELILQTGSSVFCGAGHDIYVFDDSGLIKHHLQSENSPLGIPTAEFQTSDRIDLKPGELVLVVTDGVYEAFSPDGELFGRPRLFDLIKTCRRSHAQGIVNSVQTAINTFCRGVAQQDDVTIVAIKVRE